MKSVERNASGRLIIVTIPISDSRWRTSSEKPFEIDADARSQQHRHHDHRRDPAGAAVEAGADRE